MSHIIRRVSAFPALLIALSLGACDTAGNGEGENDRPAAAGGKADDTTVGPIGALTAGTQGSGTVAGDAVHVYVVDARPGSVINARVARTDGDLDPTAFLYRNLRAAQENDYIGPSHGFSNTSSSIEAAWTVPSSGEVLLIIGAGGDSAGSFEVELSCHAGSPYSCTENGVEDEVSFCEAVRSAWLVCFEEAEDESDELCADWVGYEDTTADDECCELWEAQGLAREEFCAW
jgi:hypothetical protein